MLMGSRKAVNAEASVQIPEAERVVDMWKVVGIVVLALIVAAIMASCSQPPKRDISDQADLEVWQNWDIGGQK